MTSRRSEIRGWAWLALVTNVGFVLSWLVAATWQGPRYSVLAHTISDMYAVTAPRGALLAWIITVCGAAVIGFALRSVPPSLTRSRSARAGSVLLAVSILGFGDLLSPLEREACRLADPGCAASDQTANLGGTLDNVLSILGLFALVAAGFFLAAAMRQTPGWERWARSARWASIGVIVLMVATVVADPAGLGGLFERLLAAFAALAVAALAWAVLVRTAADA